MCGESYRTQLDERPRASSARATSKMCGRGQDSTSDAPIIPTACKWEPQMGLHFMAQGIARQESAVRFKHLTPIQLSSMTTTLTEAGAISRR